MINMFIALIGIACIAIVVAGVLLLFARKKITESSSLFQEAKEQIKNSKRDLEICKAVSHCSGCRT